MAPRAIWSGTISFGLVSIPVRMYSAIEEHKVHFHYLHRKDDSPIGCEKYCKREDRPVPDGEIGKAFEVNRSKGNASGGAKRKTAGKRTARKAA